MSSEFKPYEERIGSLEDQVFALDKERKSLQFALSTLQAENERLRGEVETHQKEWRECGEWLNRHSELWRGRIMGGSAEIATYTLEILQQRLKDAEERAESNLLLCQECGKGFVDGDWAIERKALTERNRALEEFVAAVRAIDGMDDHEIVSKLDAALQTLGGGKLESSLQEQARVIAEGRERA